MQQSTYSGGYIGFETLVLTDAEVAALRRVELSVQPVMNAIFGAAVRGRVTAIESLAGPTTTCSATAAVFRVSGIAVVEGVNRDWSAIGKDVHPRGGRRLWETATDPFDPFHVYREVDINRLVLPHVGAQSSASESRNQFGIVPPKLLTDMPLYNGRHVMWFENVEGLTGLGWPEERMVLACRHLGQTQGAYRTPEGVPSDLLRQSWLRAHLSRYDIDAACLDSPELCDQPLFASFTPQLLIRSLRLWQHTSERLDILDRLPQTFCHRDFWLGNLKSALDEAGIDRTVAFDWAFAGLGAIGEEAGAFVANTVVDLRIEPAKMRSFARDCLNAYVQGLADVSWKGDRRVVELGFLLGVSTKFSPWIPSLAQQLVGNSPPVKSFDYTDPGIEEWIDVRWAGRPLDAIAPHVARVANFLAECGERALDHAARLDLGPATGLA